MAYLLDANVFIQAKNLHYGFDFCPAFWEWLLIENGAGRIYSIERVGDELEAGADVLAKWAGDQGAEFFLKPDAPMMGALGEVSQWAMSQKYTQAASSTFLQLADSYLVAMALAHGHSIVTHEIASPSIRKIKIPDACVPLDIKCVTPYEMLRHEKARFVLGPSA